MGTPNTTAADVFPPLRAQAPDPSIFLPYITEDIAFEEEYEEYLSDLGWSDTQSQSSSSEAPLFSGTSAWHRLPEFVTDITDGISDSESIVSIGELGDEARLNADREDRDVPDENLNNWEVRYAQVEDSGSVTDSLYLAHESQDNGSADQISRSWSPVKLRKRPQTRNALQFGFGQRNRR